MPNTDAEEKPIPAEAEATDERSASGSASGSAPGAIHCRGVSIALPESALAAVESAVQSGDKRFPFILTHVGENKNGDFFTPEELKLAAQTAVGRKIDIFHSKEFRDIVGGIVEAVYVEDGEKSRVECVGELYTEESEPARLAHKLMQRKIVGHVSMECDYAEGECSICGKRIKSKAEYCMHLKNFKGRAYQGKPCYEILHGITFTGMGLLDREGADPGAGIGQVAEIIDEQSEQEAAMADGKDPKKPGNEPAPGTGKKAAQDNVPPSLDQMDEAQVRQLAKEQQAQIDSLTKELDALRLQLDEAMAKEKSVARQVKAEKLLGAYSLVGRSFADDAAKAAELARLMKLSDEAFAATEETIQAIATSNPKAPEAGAGEPKGDKTKGQASLASDAGVKPRVVADPAPGGGTLAERLANGVSMYHEVRSGR